MVCSVRVWCMCMVCTACDVCDVLYRVCKGNRQRPKLGSQEPAPVPTLLCGSGSARCTEASVSPRD